MIAFVVLGLGALSLAIGIGVSIHTRLRYSGWEAFDRYSVAQVWIMVALVLSMVAQVLA